MMTLLGKGPNWMNLENKPVGIKKSCIVDSGMIMLRTPMPQPP